jgi:poly-gamma-glutamate system protein
MKKLYWRPQRLSIRVLVLIALVAAGSLGGVETCRVKEKQRYYSEKRRAARLALRAFQMIKAARLRRGLAIDLETDPAQSGLIGVLLSPVTTNTGHLTAKQTSVNPNFAAVVVDMLLRAGVQPGDTVALGISGSFPALNICALAAVQTLKLNPLTVASAGSSQWGANHPRMMWPDIEGMLVENKLLTHRSLAVSWGGIDDRALGVNEEGRRLIENAIRRNDFPLLDVGSYDDSLEKRMTLYQEDAGEGEIKAYVNVGGGTTSVGTKVGRDLFRPGLNRRLPRGPQIDSVMRRFAERDIPVIHLGHVGRLAERYGLELTPTVMPPVGRGKIFVREAYNVWLALGALGLVIALLVLFLRLDWGYRLFAAKPRDADSHSPEQMV